MFETVMNQGMSRPVGVPHREIALVVLHRGDRHFRRQLEELRIETPRERHRPLDQAGHFVEQRVGDDCGAA